MQENGLADAQGAASVSVVPSTATAAAAGMDIGTPRYDAAVGRLLEAGALERAEEIDRLHRFIGVHVDRRQQRWCSWRSAPRIHP
jgi:hypothetical protein